MTEVLSMPAEKAGAVPLTREMPLIPSDSIAGRALVVVIAIMTLLACLTAGGAMLVTEASAGWRTSVAQEMTIQVKPKTGMDMEATLAKVAEAVGKIPGVTVAHVVSKSDSEQMLEPWLGEGLDLSQLPVPRLVTVQTDAHGPADLERVRSVLQTVAPDASLDDHALWLSRLNTMADMIVVFAVAVFALMIVAMGTAIGFATRGAMAGAREIVEVLHFVGASDAFIARQFQGHFMRLGLRGAAIGGGCAAAFFLTSSLLSVWWSRSEGGEQIAALFGSFSLGLSGYLVIAAICGAITALTGYLSRGIVFHQLRALL